MELHSSNNSGEQATDIKAIRLAIQEAARRREKDGIALLGLLRQLEELHRDIRETFFQDSLPTNRQRLYNLLRDIEISGGWPYIQRMKLKELLDLLDPAVLPELSDSSEISQD